MKKWQKDKLKNVATIITKGSTPTTYGYKYLESGIPFVKVENLANGKIDKDSITQFISDDAHKFQKRSQLIAGDILFSIAGTIGRVALVQKDDVPSNTNQALAIIRGTENKLNPTFLRILLESHISSKVIGKARGGAMNNISLSDLSDMEVILPEIEEQEKLVDAIETQFTRLDAAIKSLKTIKDKLAFYRKSILKAAFDANCQYEKLGKIFKTTSGGTPSRSSKRYYSGAITWLKSGELNDNMNIEDSDEHITQEAVDSSSAKKFPPNTVLIALYGATTGKLGIIRSECTTNQAVCGIFPDKNMYPEFVFYYLLFRRSSLISQGKGGAQPNISQGIVRDISFPIISRQEQYKILNRIESRFSVIDKVGEVVDNSLLKAERLRRSILKAAFEGKLVN